VSNEESGLQAKKSAYSKYGDGHRKRVKNKFVKLPIRSLDDYEILEMLLYSVFSRKDTRKIARDLLSEFGSLEGVLNAEKADLLKIPDIGECTIYHFKLLLDLYSRLLLPIDAKVEVLSNWKSVIQFCNLTMGFKKKEAFRIFYLNNKNHLIADEIFENGTLDKIHIYPREVVKSALEHCASAIILVHNHPSGDPSPSDEDIVMTKEIAKALKLVSINVHDHLIIAQNKHYSFRASGLL